MLMNNLDPEVGERPQDLVVYGGIGKAARNWECYDAIVRSLRELGNEETLLVQSGKPVGVFRTHADGPPRPHLELHAGPGVGDLGALLRARPQGPDDVRPDDRGLVDLHRHPGDPAGDLRDLRRGRPPALRREPEGPPGPHRRARGHGRSTASRRHDERRGHDRGRGRPPPDRAAPRGRLPRRDDRERRRGPGPCPRGRRLRDAAVDRAPGQRRRRPPRDRAARCRPRPRHRPDQRPRPPQRLRAQRHDLRARPSSCATPTPRATWRRRVAAWAST